MSRSRWVPTSRTSWPLSASGKLSAVAIMPDPRTLTVVIVFPPKSQNKVRTKYRADQMSSSHTNPPHYTSFSLESVLNFSGLLRDREAGFKGAAAPLRGPGGTLPGGQVIPQSLFLPRPQGAKKLCHSPDELFGLDWVRLTSGSLILVNLYIMLAFLKSSGQRRNKKNVEHNCNV